jgi:hypothetical protein
MPTVVFDKFVSTGAEFNPEYAEELIIVWGDAHQYIGAGHWDTSLFAKKDSEEGSFAINPAFHLRKQPNQYVCLLADGVVIDDEYASTAYRDSDTPKVIYTELRKLESLDKLESGENYLLLTNRNTIFTGSWDTGLLTKKENGVGGFITGPSGYIPPDHVAYYCEISSGKVCNFAL